MSFGWSQFQKDAVSKKNGVIINMIDVVSNKSDTVIIKIDISQATFKFTVSLLLLFASFLLLTAQSITKIHYIHYIHSETDFYPKIINQKSLK